MKKMLTNIFRRHHACRITNFKQILFTLGLFFSLLNFADAQVTGKVFQDFNANGMIGSADFGLAGVTVKAFNASGIQVGTTQYTDANGNYSIAVTAGTQVRIEFSGFPSGFYSGPYGTASGTAVQFTTGGTSGVNLGVNDPDNYCQENPKVYTPVWTNGNPLGGGNAGTTCALFQYNYNDNGATANPTGTGPNATCASTNDKVGALYG
ncbi:MAG: SdrD B-like domain-containing protein, partial [Saprospiraceae bacterium]